MGMDWEQFNPAFLNRRRLICGMTSACLATALMPGSAMAQQADKTKLTLVLDDSASMLHLPVLLALHLGYFRAEGLQIDIVEQPLALDASRQMPTGLLVRSAPFVYSLQTGEQDDPWVSVVQTGRTPQWAVGVSKKALPGFKSIKDIQGRKVGVMETGSLAQFCVDYALMVAGGNPKNISYVALGNPQTAMTQLRNGGIDVLCASDPLMTVLEKKGDLELLRNFRSLKETQRVFGGLLPGNALLVPGSLAVKQPQVCQALVNGVMRAGKWLRTAGPSDLLNTMLDSTYLTDRAVYLNAVDNMRESYSLDGMLSNEAFAVALKLCKTLVPQMGEGRRKLGNTFTNEFVLQAKKRFKV